MGIPDEPDRLDGYLCRIAAFGLRRAEAHLEIPDDEWPRVLGALGRQRLTGLAVAAMEAGWLRLSDPQRRTLLEEQRASMLHALGLERVLLKVSEVFEDEGIDLVVLKGPALAHTMYPDPSWRPFGDLDILVRTRDWRRACALLPRLGYRRKYPEPRPGFVERFGHTAVHVGDGIEVDLHRTLVGGPFGLWMNPDDLQAQTEKMVIGGRFVQRLDDTALLAHACIHAALGFRPPLLLPLRDVAQVSMQGAVDWEHLKALSLRWRIGVVMSHAFRSVEDVLGFVPPHAAGVRGEAFPRRERNALAAYTTARRDRGGKALSSLRAIPGVRAKAAYVSALLFPTREFLEARANGGGASYLARWAIPVRRLRRAFVRPRRGPLK